MNLIVGFIPYLNMVPFHQGFGPEQLQQEDYHWDFRKVSPRALGIEAEAAKIDAGAMSLVDSFRLADHFEPIGSLGIGVKQAAGSVLLFSKVPIERLQGLCAVTDETATSVRLLQILLEKRYDRKAVKFGRIASSVLYDGSAEALLLIGDEALRAKREGIKDLPVLTDLATEWLAWQGNPFVFARWMVRKELPERAKALLQINLRNSLTKMFLRKTDLANHWADAAGMPAGDLEAYWDGFVFELTPEHDRSIAVFKELLALSSPAAVPISYV